jgi:hypothetical protein
MADANDSGTKFENEVANLYRLLGYEVNHNQILEGFQIDLTASRRVPGADETRLIIECKFKSSGSVSNDDLSKLSRTFSEVGQSKGFHKAIMVTNSSFSVFAKEFAAHYRALNARTGRSAPVPCIGTLASRFRPLELLPSHQGPGSCSSA